MLQVRVMAYTDMINEGKILEAGRWLEAELEVHPTGNFTLRIGELRWDYADQASLQRSWVIQTLARET